MKDDEKIIRKNKPIPKNEFPDWAKAMPVEERENCVHSPQCKVCNATHNGRSLRSEIEGLVIERKTYTEICNIVHDRYGLQLFDYNIGNHMNKHAPDYAKALERLLHSELGEVLQGTVGPIVDQFKFLLAVVQVAMHRLIQNPEEVSLADGIRAAEKFHVITEGLDVRHHDMVTQKEINTILDIMQNVMTREQVEEVRRRFLTTKQKKCSPAIEPETSDGVPGMVMVDGQLIDSSKIPTLPPEEASEEG